MTALEAERKKSGTQEFDALAHLRAKAKKDKERYKPIPMDDYINGVFSGKYPVPKSNAAELVVDALSVVPPVPHKAGYTEYGVFTQRDDELAVKGIPWVVDSIMNFLEGEAFLNSRDRMLLLVAPTGAGKTIINDVIKMSVEHFTENSAPPPVYGIVGCPVHEDPLHALDKETRKLLRKEKGLEVRGILCPHCQRAAEARRGTMGYQEKIFDFQVEAVPFSASIGRGITRLEASNVEKSILLSNRGVLHLPEMGKNLELLKLLNDVTRGRRYTIKGSPYSGMEGDVAGTLKGETYELDNIIIADMNLEEWESFVHPENMARVKSYLERMEVVKMTYPLDPVSELDILKKKIRTSMVPGIDLCLSPNSLEKAAEWSVRTRIRPYGVGDLKLPNGKPMPKEGTKLKLYSGEDVTVLHTPTTVSSSEIVYTQADRREIEKMSRDSKEGEEGISVPAFWNIIQKILGEQKPDKESGNAHVCVDYLEIKKGVREYTESLPKDPQKLMKDQLDIVDKEYDEWAVRTVKQAFLDNYPVRANKVLNDYLEEIDPLINPDPNRPKKTDPATGKELEPDWDAIVKFENAVVTKPFSSKDISSKNYSDRKDFRNAFNQFAYEVFRREGRPIQFTDLKFRYPNSEDGLIGLISEQSTGKQHIDPKVILKLPSLDKRQQELMDNMEKRLLTEYGFCPDCAPKIVKYVKGKI